MWKWFPSGAVGLLGAVVSETMFFGLVSEHMKTSESMVQVLGVKGVGAVCFASDLSGMAVIFFGDVVTLVSLLEVGLALQAATVSKGELESAGVVVLDVSALK